MYLFICQQLFYDFMLSQIYCGILGYVHGMKNVPDIDIAHVYSLTHQAILCVPSGVEKPTCMVGGKGDYGDGDWWW